MSKLSKILLILSGICIVSFAVVLVLAGSWVPFLWIPLGLFAFFVGAVIYQDRAILSEFFLLKTTKHGMNMGVLILLVLALIAAVNFISVKHYKTWDFSKNQINTLSDQSIKLVKSLDSDLSVKFFYQQGAEGVEETKRAFRELLKKYQDESPFVKLEFIEVNARPDLAEQYGVNKGNGVVFLDYKGRRNKLEKIEEQEITSALVKVTREKDKVIYFSVGHGEYDLNEDKDIKGLAALKGLLEGNRYVVKPLAFNDNPQVPKDASVLVIAGPTQAFLDFESKAVEEYLKGGGSVFMALKPQTNHGLSTLLGKLGVKLGNNYIVNVLDTPFGKAVNPQGTAATHFSNTNQITKPFGQSQFVLMRMPQSLTKDNVPAGVTVDEFVKTSDKAVNFPNNQFNTGGTPGEYTLGMEVKGKYPGVDKASDFSLVLVGDSDFLNNQMLYQNLNRDLALNTISYLSREENLISIMPKEVSVTKINMSANQFYLYIFAFAIPLPLLLLGSSMVLWFRRRHA